MIRQWDRRLSTVGFCFVWICLQADMFGGCFKVLHSFFSPPSLLHVAIYSRSSWLCYSVMDRRIGVLVISFVNWLSAFDYLLIGLIYQLVHWYWHVCIFMIWHLKSNPLLHWYPGVMLCVIAAACSLPCDEFNNNIILENPFDIMKSKCCKVTNKQKKQKKQKLHLPVHWLRILNTTLHVGDGVVQLIECLTGEGSKDPRFEPRQEHKDNLWALSESNMRWLAVGVPIPRVHTRA